MSALSSVWEENLARNLAVSVSQLRFTVCLFMMIPVSWLQYQIRSVQGGHFFALFSGLLLVYLPFGNGILLLLPPVAATFLAIRLTPRYCGKAVWFVCFPYLIYTHFKNASGAAWQDGEMDATGALMILFLKCIAIAQCCENATHSRERMEKLTPYEKDHMVMKSPSLLAFLSYLFCFGALLSGPFLEFKDYTEFIERKGLWSGKIPPRGTIFCFHLLRSIIALLFLVFVGMRYEYPLLFTESYKQSTLLEKFFAAYLVCICYRLRFYFAWLVAEAASIASGFGYNGKAIDQDTKEEIEKWDRCKNVDIMATEFQESFAKIPANWNICTGTFLRRYVYDQLTPADGRPGFYTLLLTQLISGLWHGLYPGYFLFFASAAVAQFSSKILHKWERQVGLLKNPMYKAIKICFSILTLNYTAVAFIILSFDKSIEVYRSMLFIPHLVCAGICIFGPFLSAKKAKAT